MCLLNYAESMGRSSHSAGFFRSCHALQHRFFAGRVAADDPLQGLKALDIVGDALEEGLVDDVGRVVGLLCFRGGGCGAVVCQVDAEGQVHGHCGFKQGWMFGVVFGMK